MKYLFSLMLLLSGLSINAMNQPTKQEPARSFETYAIGKDGYTDQS